MKTLITRLPILLLFFFARSFSQNWVEKKNDPNENFYSIQQEFNTYWSNKTYERGKGYKAFKRWEWYTEPRVYPSGDMRFASKAKAYEEFQNYLLQNPAFAQRISAQMGTTSASGNWTPIGPFGSPVDGDAGRLTFIRFVPGNANRIFIGTGAGGLWETNDGGTTWTTNTNNLAVLGCSDLAIDPTNVNIMYLATGDIDAGDTYSTGILKSTDGGLTWNTTGLAWPVSNGRRIGRLLINPNNPNILLAATSMGIYRTTNAGVTWSNVKSGNYKDIEFKSGNVMNVFAVTGSTFIRSIDGGQTFTTTATGLPTSGVTRMALSVTPADSNYIYILCGASSDNGFYGLYRSTDGGISFTMMSSSPNIFGWSTNGSDSGGQAWYDIACGVSPTNKDEIICGGVNSWKSTDGGASWTINSHWYGGGGNPYVHADLHAVEYFDGLTCFLGTDGGIARTTDGGNTWQTINGLMNIAQVTRIGNSSTTSNYVISGHQDNGTNLLSGSTWREVYGGDGSDCFVDWSNNNTLIASYVNGDFKKSTNGGATFSDIQNGLTGTGAWIAPIIQSSNDANVFYCAYKQVYISTNKGGLWTQMGTLPGSSNILFLAAAPSNTNVLYAARATAIYKTTDNGASWTSITSGLPVSAAQITRIAVDNTNENHIFVTFSGYSSTNKVFSSVDGGVTWTNISNGLPNIPVNCITYYNNSNDELYIGTDVGVYFKNASMNSWIPFMTGLPNVIVNDIDVFYPTKKIRCGTYGRGVWQSDKYVPSLDIALTDIIKPTNTTSTCNSDITPKITLTNIGSSVITSATIMYQLDTTPTQTLNWSGALASNNSTVITLNSYTSLSSSVHSFSVWVENPNSIIDQDTTNNTLVSTFTITSAPIGSALPFMEDFENVTFPPNNWVLEKANTINAGASWNRVSNSTGLTAGSAAVAMMDNNSSSTDISGQIDALISPALNFSGSNTTLNLEFDVSHKNYGPSAIDSLNVKISTDCGSTWTQIYSKGGNQLSTSPGTLTTAYTPATNSEWRRESVSLASYISIPVVYLKFESRSGWGNNIYIDNVNISYTAPTAVPTASFTSSSTNCTGAAIIFTDQSTDLPSSWSWSFPGGSPVSSTVQNPSITYTASGIYTVSLQSTNTIGTSASESKTIAVNLTPVLTVNNAAVCKGSSAILTASGADSYAWNTGLTTASISVTPSVTTNYTVTGYTDGCSVSTITTVSVNPSPSVLFASINSTMCVNHSTVALYGNPSGGTFSGTGVSGSTFDPGISGAGTFTISYSYTDPNNCSNAAKQAVIVDLCTSIKELNGSNVSVFPNPVKNEITITITAELMNKTRIEVYDALGKKVLNEKLENQINTVNVSNLAKGIYNLRMISDKYQKQMSIIKE